MYYVRISLFCAVRVIMFQWVIGPRNKAENDTGEGQYPPRVCIEIRQDPGIKMHYRKQSHRRHINTHLLYQNVLYIMHQAFSNSTLFGRQVNTYIK